MIPKILSDLLNWEAWDYSDNRYIWCRKDCLDEWEPTLRLCGIIIEHRVRSDVIDQVNNRLVREGKPRVAFTTSYLFIPAPDITGNGRPPYHKYELDNHPGGKFWCIGAGGRLDYKATVEHFARTLGDHYVPEQSDRPQHRGTQTHHR